MNTELTPQAAVMTFHSICPAIQTVLSVVLQNSINIDQDDLSVSMNYQPFHKTEKVTDDYEKLFKIKSALIFAAISCKIDVVRTVNDKFQTYHPSFGWSPEDDCPAIAALNAMAILAPTILVEQLSDPLDKQNLLLDIINKTIGEKRSYIEELNALVNILNKYQDKPVK